MNTPESSFARLYKLVVVGPSIYSRIFWFILGSPLSMGVNLTIFTLTNQWMGLSERVSYFISLTVVTFVFSLWNYFVNFRSARNFRECLPRYVAALGCCYAINYLIASTGFKQIAHGSIILKYAVIVGSTFIVSGVKFLLYHFWVYPHTPAPEEVVESPQR